MAQDTRVGDRQPTSMRIKLKYPDVETFIQKYAVNISRGGIFIATKTPKPVGTPLKFEFILAAGAEGLSIIRGEGQVLWTREFDPTQPSKAHGMGVKFTRLDSDSQQVIDRALAFRAQKEAHKVEDEEPTARRDESQPLPAAAIAPTPTAAPVSPPLAEPPASIAEPPAPIAGPAAPLLEPAAPLLEPIASAPPPLIPEIGSQPIGRAPNEVTKPLPIDMPPIGGRTKNDVTRPISVEQAEAEAEADPTKKTILPSEAPRVKVAIERDPSREIRIRGASRQDAVTELDEIAREWGVSEEQIERVLKRRRPRMVEATAELERLLRKPAKAPPPTKAEALAGLKQLLAQRAPVLEIDRTPRPHAPAQAAGGQSEESESHPVKKAR